MTLKNLRIGLDIDETLADFLNPYKARFDTNKYPNRLTERIITRNVARVLKFDRNFWLTLPIKNSINFIPELYCTSRVCNKEWTKKWLELNGFPKRPIYQILGYKSDKSKLLRGKVDIFVDDSMDNFILLNSAGIPCILLDQYNSKPWSYKGKVHSLNFNEIVEEYFLFKHMILPYFKELI